jgi:hypothetical protein
MSSRDIHTATEGRTEMIFQMGTVKTEGLTVSFISGEKNSIAVYGL